MTGLVLVKLLLAICVLLPGAVAADTLRVAAAANLRYVMPELVEQYQRQTSTAVSISYGSSGNLATQIIHHAPYDMLFSANPFYIQQLIERHKNRGDFYAFADSEVVLFRNHRSALNLDPQLRGLKRAVTSHKLKKFAIANPRHAPYGQLARQLLQQHDVWENIQSSLLLGESASQTLQFALTTDVAGAIVPYPYMTQPDIKRQGVFIKLPGKLSQQALIMRQADARAEHFMAFVMSEQAAPIWRKHGYLPAIGDSER